MSIPEFYKDKKIFVTGATGFMGKALLEKLLRSCPETGTIYILMRPKKGQQLETRLEQLMSQRVFERLKNERPGILEKKLVPLAGDVSELNLGLSEQDRQMIVNDVSIIYHIAASVRFDDPLKEAVILNMRGTREVCQLALDAKNLQILVHVSTAYANCDRKEAHEQLYPPKANWRQTIELAEKCDKNMLSILTLKYMNEMPNTYTFTKSLAEHIVFDMCRGKIPVKVIRPSIVVSSLKEPVRGWIDNFNGPMGILTACGKGIMRTHYVKIESKPDYIPVDIVTKSMVVATWDLAVRQNKEEPEIIQCTSHSAEWIRPSLEKLATTAIEISKDYPFNDILWVPSNHYTNYVVLWYIRMLFVQLFPALFLDLLMKIAGRKPILTKLQRKIFVAQNALRYFIHREWTYTNYNLLELQKKISNTDFDDWEFNFHGFDFSTYIRESTLGTRRYLLNEPDETLPQARKHYNRMLWADRITKAVFYVLIFLLVLKLDLFSMALAKVNRVGQRWF